MDATTTTTTVELDEDARLWLWHGVFGLAAGAGSRASVRPRQAHQPDLSAYRRKPV